MTKLPLFCAVVAGASLALGGCSTPDLSADVARELQGQVQDIAVLTARGDTAHAVEHAETLAHRVRTAQQQERISEERAARILSCIDRLVVRLQTSGAAPAPQDLPVFLTQPAPATQEPAALVPKPNPAPSTAHAGAPANQQPDEPDEPAPPAPRLQEAPQAPAPAPVVILPGPVSGVDLDDDDGGGDDNVDDDFEPDTDDDGGKGRGRGSDD